jgi:hypothetical protein
VETVAVFEREKVWSGLWRFERMLHKLSWKWARSTSYRIDKDDFFHELVLLYYSVRNRYVHLEDKQFAKVLFACAHHKCLDLVCINQSYVPLDENFPPVSVRIDQFSDLFKKFFYEDLESMLENCPVARDIFRTILDLPSELVDRIGTTRAGNSRRNWRVCKIDVQRYLLKKGYRISEFRIGLETLKEAYCRLTSTGNDRRLKGDNRQEVTASVQLV